MATKIKGGQNKIKRRNLLIGSSALSTGFIISQVKKKALGATTKVELLLHNASIPTYVLRNFTRRSGIAVNSRTIPSGVDFATYLAKTPKNAAFDVLIAPNYEMNHLRSGNYIKPLDHSRLPAADNIFESFNYSAFDEQRRFSLPYLWGTIGIGYDQSKIKTKPNSWKLLYDSSTYYDQASLLDVGQYTVRIGLKLLGYSINDLNRAKLLKVEEMLLCQKKVLKAMHRNQGSNLLSEGKVNLIQEYSGNMTKLLLKDEKFSYLIPQEGSIIWENCLLLGSNGANSSGAYQLLDFLNLPGVSADIALQEGCGTPNKLAYQMLPADYKDNGIIFPATKDLARCEQIHPFSNADRQTINNIMAKLA